MRSEMWAGAHETQKCYYEHGIVLKIKTYFCHLRHIPILSVFKQEINFRRDLGGVEIV